MRKLSLQLIVSLLLGLAVFSSPLLDTLHGHDSPLDTNDCELCLSGHQEIAELNPATACNGFLKPTPAPLARPYCGQHSLHRQAALARAPPQLHWIG